MISLYPFQVEIVARAIEHHRPLIVMPTGSGKTLVAAEIIKRAENSYVLFFAHRRELIHHARKKLSEFGIRAGVILAGHPLDNMQRVQVASVQTLWSRCFRQGQEPPLADILFIDEAHHCTARTYRNIIERYPNAQLIGLTATPIRRDGRGLGSTFSTLVEGPQVQRLIDGGYLVGTKVYAPTKPDLEGVRVRQGDYVEEQLAERMDQPKLVGDIITHWHRHAQRRKTVVFATSVTHSIHLYEEFIKSGVRAAHIDGSTPKDERDEILARLSRGDLEVVCNCMVLTEGWDQPDVACCILARPTKSMGLYRQMVGRVLRPYPGKDHALVLDHAGAVFQHGFVEDPMIWGLDKDCKAEAPAQEARQLKPSNRLLECSQCHAIRTGGKPCPHCGFMPKRPGEYLAVREGNLARLDQDYRTKPLQHSTEERQGFYRGLLHLAINRGKNPNSAAHRYRERFGEWPPFSWKQLGPINPSSEAVAWDQHCRIKYAKAMQKAAANG
jgi:superfamily II DNA or RNA helicase